MIGVSISSDDIGYFLLYERQVGGGKDLTSGRTVRTSIVQIALLPLNSIFLLV